jgi:integrase
MGRPPLPLGTWGKIRTHQVGEQTWRAIANYKDYDGITRPVERVGATAAKAANNLREALRDRSRKAANGMITPETKVAAAAEEWLNGIDASDKASNTKKTYRDTWNRYLEKSIGQLRVREAKNVSLINRVITDVRDKHGRGAAAHVKVVLSGVYSLIVRHDALEENPVREIESLGKKKRKQARLIGAKTVGPILKIVHTSPNAERWDLVDLTDVLSGVGCRIGELLALDWETSINFDAGTISFHGTLIRTPGAGLVIQPHTKSTAGMRTIRPPSWVMDVLKRRHAASTTPWAFPSPTGGLRDPDHVRKYIRRLFADTPYSGLHPHDWRHYVAGVLDVAKLTSRQIADYLGHERISTTQDDYMERGVVGEDAGPALESRPADWLPKNPG